jgi:hypothetical protein
MSHTWRGRALGCPPQVSVGGRNNHAVVVLTHTAFLGFDFGVEDGLVGGTEFGTAILVQMGRWTRNFPVDYLHPTKLLLTTNYRCSLKTIAELRQFWRVMRRLQAGLVVLGAALSLAAQYLPGVPAGKPAPIPSARSVRERATTLVSDGTQRSESAKWASDL